MQLPAQLINSLQKAEGFNEQDFIKVHQIPNSITSVRVNPLKRTSAFEHEKKVPWCANGFYLNERPSFTFDPFFHAGSYYVQEASSMFVEQALRQTSNLAQPLRILDLCAAPGGKSTLLQSLISAESLLVSNEVIKTRANILKDNIIKWGSDNVVVTNNDPKDFAALSGFFDVIVVDAPCSGSGLFKKDENAINEWSENNVMLCSQRQQRILADILPCLKENGILIYSTCSYSVQEDEAIMDWFTEEFPVENIKLQINPDWKITEVHTSNNNYGYRFWPYLVQGEGFFLTVFRKKQSGFCVADTTNKLKICTQKEKEAIQSKVEISNHEFIYFGSSIFAWPKHLVADMHIIADHLKAIYSGVQIGELKHNKLIPAHALAMSSLILPDMLQIELSKEDAIKYLQRKDFVIDTTEKGWAIVTCNSKTLGWVNLLGNRFNNYYPKELRILKDKP